MTASAAAKVEDRRNWTSLEETRDEVDNVLGLGLIVVLVNAEIVFTEPFLEPIGLFRAGALLGPRA
jgi:hypothetical protein